MQRQYGLLGLRLDRDKPHIRPSDCLANRLGVFEATDSNHQRHSWAPW
jgi:hypothetical protein